MWYRLAFALIAGFFLVMNVLLWRAEISGGNNVGGFIPAEIVWKKILTAPDTSPLEIRHHGEKAGSFRWVPNVSEARPASAREAPEGMVRTPADYDLEVEGHFVWAQKSRIGFSCRMTLATNYAWRDFSVRLGMRPNSLEIRSFAQERTVRFVVTDGSERVEHVLTFEELQNPEKLFRQFAGPWIPAGLLAGIMPLTISDPTTLAGGLDWRARSDHLILGSVRIRGYRLEARLFDRLQASIFINTLGEVVRVEFPDHKIVFVNEALASL